VRGSLATCARWNAAVVSQAFAPVPKLPSVNNNNAWGAGSGAMRMYIQTVTTFADNVDEIQTIQTTATSGQTLKGGFKLSYKGGITALIPAEAEPAEVERSIESSLYHAGDVSVTRSVADSQVSGVCDAALLHSGHLTHP
jgi:hypothetical protein